jgi:hypothetical protein
MLLNDKGSTVQRSSATLTKSSCTALVVSHQANPTPDSVTKYFGSFGSCSIF